MERAHKNDFSDADVEFRKRFESLIDDMRKRADEIEKETIKPLEGTILVRTNINRDLSYVYRLPMRVTKYHVITMNKDGSETKWRWDGYPLHRDDYYQGPKLD
jgi:hypothetical protein